MSDVGAILRGLWSQLEAYLKQLVIPHQRGYMTENSLPVTTGIVNGVFTTKIQFRVIDYLDRFINNGYFYARIGDIILQLNNGPLIYIYAGNVVNLAIFNEIFDVETVIIRPVGATATVRFFLI